MNADRQDRMNTDYQACTPPGGAEGFHGLSDEALVSLAQQGDNQALLCLLTKYRNAVRIRARSYYLVGADHEDLVQEGMIGLYKAIRDYQPARQATFWAFADLCVKRQIISAIKNATRLKHTPLNRYISLDKPAYSEDSDKTLLDTIAEESENPEEMVIRQERSENLRAVLNGLFSPFEQQVLDGFLEGKSYKEIAHSIGRHVKGVDNALQRIKRKMAKLQRISKEPQPPETP